ncbi:hypothetical protein LAZ67_1007725 [Cordylochernes scorpioides]|uniref:Uncharacterized protein n=1 Tax=Cordylochernes scorpioides TaxID=51811 RepID=A0ABY6K195_9ARAC|nr:hypothetical protein LAZ67_1007725 [Cordylochernes scorpioides]
MESVATGHVSDLEVVGLFATWSIGAPSMPPSYGVKIVLRLQGRSHRCMGISEALHWTRQQQQQEIDMDPEQQLYTPKIEDIATAVIEMHGNI